MFDYRAPYEIQLQVLVDFLRIVQFSCSLRAQKYRKSGLYADFVRLFIRAETRNVGSTSINKVSYAADFCTNE